MVNPTSTVRPAKGLFDATSANCHLGDNETVAKWETKARRQLRHSFQQPITTPVTKKRKVNVTEACHVAKDNAAIASPKSPDGDHVLDFLKSRPQLVKLPRDALQDHKPSLQPETRTFTGQEASDLVHRDHFKGCPEAWQQDETIDNFLRRVPVADPDTAAVGPWLWVTSPQINTSHQKQTNKVDVNAFIESGDSLLEAFGVKRAEVEAENRGKAVATITRKMGPYRDQLEEDLLSAAVKTGTTCGKWMLFPPSDALPHYWRLIAEATSAGKLGPTSKVATPDPYNGKDETLICVYTYDFTDLDDVRRVLDELVELQLCRPDGKSLYYKIDAWTYMGISSNNDYKLRASLYSSIELFKNGAKPLKEGPIARLKKRNQKVNSFLSS